MPYLSPPGSTLTLASGASSGTFVGGDVSTIKAGMALAPGKTTGIGTAGSETITSVTPNGNGIGGAFTIAGSFGSAYSGTPYCVDPMGGSAPADAYATFGVVKLLNAIAGAILFGTSKILRLDRAAGSGPVSQLLYAIAGADRFKIEQRNAELRLAALPDGVTETGGLTVNGATGAVSAPTLSTTYLGITGSAAPIVMYDPTGDYNRKRTDIIVYQGLRFQLKNDDGSFRAEPLAFDTSSASAVFGAHIEPTVDNTYSVGFSSKRFSAGYFASGVITSSDARIKTAVEPLTEAETAWAADLARAVGSYRFLAAIDAKGEAARHHIGLTVQHAIELGQARGLNPFRYGLICFDEHTAEPARSAVFDDDGMVVVPAREAVPASNLYSLRTDELALFIARGQEARFTALEAQLAA